MSAFCFDWKKEEGKFCLFRVRVRMVVFQEQPETRLREQGSVPCHHPGLLPCISRYVELVWASLKEEGRRKNQRRSGERFYKTWGSNGDPAASGIKVPDTGGRELAPHCMWSPASLWHLADWWLWQYWEMSSSPRILMLSAKAGVDALRALHEKWH